MRSSGIISTRVKKEETALETSALVHVRGATENEWRRKEEEEEDGAAREKKGAAAGLRFSMVIQSHI